jgi:hypothetical protein
VDAHFIPLFFYESVLSLIGVFVMIFLWRRFTARGRLLIAGDVGLLYFVWYGVERSVLETFRSGWNWTLFGLATAQIIGLGAAAAAIVAIVVRHWYLRRHPESAAVATAESSAAPSGSSDSAESVESAESAAPVESDTLAEPAEPATESTESTPPAEPAEPATESTESMPPAEPAELATESPPPAEP